MEKKSSDDSSGRRGFVRKIIGLAAAGGIAGVLLGRQVEPASAANAGEVWFDDGSGAHTTDSTLRWTSSSLGVGTSNPQAKLHVSGTTPNILMGDAANTILSGVVGGTISGGGRSGYGNLVTDNYCTIGGGDYNLAGDNAGSKDDMYATVGGGTTNLATGQFSTIAGGSNNRAHAQYSTVAGGFTNNASGHASAISGGVVNTAVGFISAIGGGANNTASGDYSTIAGGSSGSAVGFISAIGGGANNIAGGDYSTVAGGFANSASGHASAISGGVANTASGDYSIVAGGSSGSANGINSAIGGGANNIASGDYSTVCGGYGNQASAEGSMVGGGGWDGTTTLANEASGPASTIGGGLGNTATSYYATVGGGQINHATSTSSTVGGGYANTASGGTSTVGGGESNQASSDHDTVGGGINNLASGGYSSVGAGKQNTASGYASTVGGGDSNTASGSYSIVPGGTSNSAGGDCSFAAGKRAKVRFDPGYHHHGVFLFADNSDWDFRSAAVNEFAVRCTGGARFVTAIDSSGNPTATTVIDPSGRLGVGLSAPVRSVHLQGSNACFRMDRNANSAAFILVRTSNSDFNTVWKTFYVGVDASAADNGSFFIGDVHTGVSGASDKRLVIDTSGNVGVGTASPTGILDVTSTASGFLPPRMTTTQKNSIPTPPEGMIVYDTTLHKLCVRTATKWETITSS